MKMLYSLLDCDSVLPPTGKTCTLQHCAGMRLLQLIIKNKSQLFNISESIENTQRSYGVSWIIDSQMQLYCKVLNLPTVLLSFHSEHQAVPTET